MRKSGQLLLAFALAVVFLGGCEAPDPEAHQKGLTAAEAGDFAKAFELWEPAAKRGDMDCQYCMGALFYRGDGRPRDPETAATWFTKAAQQGQVQAQYMMGTLYESGEGIPLDSAKAYEWFLKAAEQGNTDAQDHVIPYLISGSVVAKDFAAAYMWICVMTADAGENGASIRQAAAQLFSPSDVAEGERRAAAWKPVQSSSIE